MTGPAVSSASTTEQVRTLRLDSPTGVLVLRETRGAITGLEWLKPRRPTRRSVHQPDGQPARQAGGHGGPRTCQVSALLVEAARQLHEYFGRRRQVFDLPLAPAGGAFHQDVWRLMREIPFGRTATYGELARELGSAAQPVGSACAANPIAIVIPCHRVVAAKGFGGFSGGSGLESKRFLLRHEGAVEAELDLF